ncbi:MAG: flagellin, partial [Planctomycetota bacterium]
AGFAGERLFDGKTTLRAGEDELTLEDLPPRNLDDVNAQDDPSGAAAVLSAALDSINTMRQRVGSFQSTSLASEQRLAENETIAAASSLSQIRDADYAKEVAEEARFGILEQTTRTAITLALTSNSRALSLLQR